MYPLSKIINKKTLIEKRRNNEYFLIKKKVNIKFLRVLSVQSTNSCINKLSPILMDTKVTISILNG